MIVRDPNDQLRSRKLVDLEEVGERQRRERFAVRGIPLGMIEPADLAPDEGGLR